MRSLICLLLLSFNATAALYDRGNGLIYDDVLDITWLQDANYAQTSGYSSNGNLTKIEAEAWVNNLNYNGHNDWRLPSTRGITDYGSSESNTELGHMFVNNLGAPSIPCCNIFVDPEYFDASIQQENNILNVLSYAYWFAESTEYQYPRDSYAYFFTNSGSLYESNGAHFSLLVWPVHDGDIGASPVPLPAGIYLFLSGLVGLGLIKRRK